MGFFNSQRGIRGIVQLLIIHLFCWLAWSRKTLSRHGCQGCPRHSRRSQTQRHWCGLIFPVVTLPGGYASRWLQMGFFNNRRGIRGIVQLLIIHLFCWLAWSVSFCLAQFGISEGITGSVNNFPSSGITCVANLAVFVTTLIRGRLDLDMAARDVLAILFWEVNNIVEINGNGLTTDNNLEGASVVMFSKGTPNSSITDFMKTNAPIVDSILLQFLPLGDADVTIEACKCKCEGEGEGCRCIVFWTTKSITVMLARRIPGTLKQFSDSQCLLPCLTCLRNGCHGCNDGLLHVETGDRLREGDSTVKSSPVEPHVICKFLEHIDVCVGEPICICIPMKDSDSDNWTKLLAKSFRSKDAESRGVTVEASETLEDYLAGGRGRKEGRVEYSIASFILPRLTEALINILLTVFFTVDGFSSSLLARRTIRDYIVDSKGSGFAANAFLTKAFVMSDADNSCQLLTFRGDLLGFRTVSFMVGFVNMLCPIVWAVLIAFDGGPDSSPPPSIPTVAVIMAAIGISFCMDLAIVLSMGFTRWKDYFDVVTFILCPWVIPCFEGLTCARWDIYFFLFFAMMHLEMICFVSGSIVARTLGVKVFGKWIYAALQILVLFKWGFGSLLLDIGENFNISEEFLGRTPPTWLSLTYSSAFLLNAVLAGVRSTWGPWLWKDNHLWSRKLLH